MMATLDNSTDVNPDPVLNVLITPELVEKHGLKRMEYEAIQNVLGREPNLTELGVFSVMWSEHCSYKSSKPLLKVLPKEKREPGALGQVLVKAGEENAGIIDIGEGWAICFKIESHNHPSAVEPFEGAATGVGGILRDIFTMGARPILLTNSLRFGEIDNPRTQQLLRGVVAGIANYGNSMGIPNIGGDVYFDSCYQGNPLVNAQCLGLLRHNQIKRGEAKGIGNPVYYVGAATGRDGLGGASFASKDLAEDTSEDRPAVQKGDPFMEKLLMEACLELMAVPDLVVGIQDMGAAGLTCSISETAARAGTAIEVELDKVPQREKGMNSYEMLLSESQERMLVIVQKGREAEVEKIFKKWDLHAVQIGQVTKGENMVVTHHGVKVVDIPAKALTDGALPFNPTFEAPDYLKAVQEWQPTTLQDLDTDGIEEALPKLLSHPTIAEKKWIWRQYDHMVLANTAVEPGSDAGVVRLRLGHGKEKFLAMANDCNNRYCYANPQRGAMIAVAECIRNLVCAGAKPLGLTDNLNFGNPNKPEAFYQLRECCEGLAKACKFFDVPVVGGNVSLYNEHQDQPIDPTPVVSIAGLIEKREHITRQFAKSGNETLIMLGDWSQELGSSYFLKVIHDLKTGDAPKLNLEGERHLHNLVLEQIKAGNVAAAHDISEGGLMVAVSEMLFGKETCGAQLTFTGFDEDCRLDGLFFGESQSRILLAVDSKKLTTVMEAAKKHNVPATVLGQFTKDPTLTVNVGEQKMTWDVMQLRESWEKSIPRTMNRFKK